MQFIRRRWQIIVASIVGPAGALIVTTAAHAAEGWGF
jgi:hypothetical protein